MANPIVLRIFAADENYTAGGGASKWRPTIAELDAEDGSNASFVLTTTNINCYDLGNDIEIEGDNDVFLDNVMSSITTFREGFIVRVKAIAEPFPPLTGSQNLLQDIQTWIPPIKKPYLWLYSANYGYHFNVDSVDPDDSETQAVVLTDISSGKSGNWRIYTLTFKFRNATNTGV